MLFKSVRSNSIEQRSQALFSKSVDRNPRFDRRSSRRFPQLVIPTPVLYLLRLLIFGVGVGAIAGTVLANIDPASRPFAKAQLNHSESSQPQKLTRQETKKQENQPAPGSLTQEINPLKAKLKALAAKYPKVKPGIFLVDLDNGAYVDSQAGTAFPAASTIKLPVLVAFFQAVDAGKIRLDEKLTIKKEVIASGSGELQYQKPGTQLTALETARKMIAISDNTATNMLIARLGGSTALNHRFQEWGLTSTAIRKPLPDLEGTNTTSPRDLADLLMRVNQGELVSLRSRDRLIDILKETVNTSLLPQGLEKDASIAHKTGDIGTVLGDAGIIDMPSGKRYITAVMVKRPYNDPEARTLIQEISSAAYQHLKWYQAGTGKPKATAAKAAARK